MDGSPGFNRDEFRSIQSVRRWDGFVFVARAMVITRHQLGGIPDKFRRNGLGSLRRAHQIVYDVGANGSSSSEL